MKPLFPATLILAAASLASANTYTPLVSLGNNTECVKCEGYHLPGEIVLRDDYVWAIHSDLPEIFHTEGVLYATFPVLPPFDTHKDGPLDEAMRTQTNRGFTSVDAPFEIFLYHLSEPGGGVAPRRLVVLVRNNGDEPVAIHPSAVIEVEGRMGDPNGPETALARRVFAGEMDTLPTVQVAAGEWQVLATTPVIAAAERTADAWPNKFINGIVRGRFDEGVSPSLDVAVLGVDGEVASEDLLAHAVGLLGAGAKSGETAMDLRIPPPACHLRRVVGVYRNFRWHGGGRFDVTALPGNNLRFQMALPAAQAMECEFARQTQAMALSPPYVHGETIGNYTIEYEVTLDLHNPGDEPVTVDVRFGKQDASIGLAWQTTLGEPGPIRTGWAGAWTKGDLPDNTRSFLEDGALTLAAGEEQRVALRFHIAGTSSLPFQIHIIREGE